MGIMLRTRTILTAASAGLPLAAPRTGSPCPSARDLLNRNLRVRVAMPEAGQVLASLRTHEPAGLRRARFSRRTVGTPGLLSPREPAVDGRDRAVLETSRLVR